MQSDLMCFLSLIFILPQLTSPAQSHSLPPVSLALQYLLWNINFLHSVRHTEEMANLKKCLCLEHVTN